MTDTLVKIGRTKPVFAVTEALDENALLTPDGAEGHPDPHVWMDVEAWSRCVDSVADALSDFDPEHAEAYRANAAAYEAQLAELHAYSKSSLATVPEKSRVLVTSHDAFNYLGRAYDLEVLGIQGLSTESEAGLSRINALVDLLEERDVAAVFVESSVPTKSIEALIAGARSRGREVKVGGELYSDAMGQDGTYEGTYVGMIDHNVTTVARALGGEAPAGGMQGKLAAGGED
jgi:manganese/zinc/iron transport system substrate-binding protein